MAAQCLKKRVPYSNSHRDTLPEGRGPKGVPRASAFWVWAVNKWGLLVSPGSRALNLLLSSLTLKLSAAAFVGSFLTHTYVTLLAKVLPK